MNTHVLGLWCREVSWHGHANGRQLADRIRRSEFSFVERCDLCGRHRFHQRRTLVITEVFVSNVAVLITNEAVGRFTARSGLNSTWIFTS